MGAPKNVKLEIAFTAINALSLIVGLVMFSVWVRGACGEPQHFESEDASG
mgnify:CR=1 FL=1